MSPSESGQQVSRERFEQIKSDWLAPGGFLTFSQTDDLIAYADQERAACEAAERGREDILSFLGRTFPLDGDTSTMQTEITNYVSTLKDRAAVAEESFHRYEERAHVAEMKLERVRAVHSRATDGDTSLCADDGHVWPCRTIRNLDSPAEGETT